MWLYIRNEQQDSTLCTKIELKNSAWTPFKKMYKLSEFVNLRHHMLHTSFMSQILNLVQATFQSQTLWSLHVYILFIILYTLYYYSADTWTMNTLDCFNVLFVIILVIDFHLLTCCIWVRFSWEFEQELGKYNIHMKYSFHG